MEKAYLCTVLQETAFIAGWSSPVARQAHNLKVVGSNPAPATIKKASLYDWLFLFLKSVVRFLFGDVCFPVSSGCAEKCRNWNCLNKAKINFIFAEGIKSGSFCFV